MNFQQFVFELAKEFPDIEMTLIEGGSKLEIPGFCKSGTAKLYSPENGVFNLETRYNQVDQIFTPEDVAGVAFNWWRSSIERWEGWANPPENWLEYFIRYGWIEEKIETIKTYEAK
jgi:hypothetical protein